MHEFDAVGCLIILLHSLEVERLPGRLDYSQLADQGQGPNRYLLRLWGLWPYKRHQAALLCLLFSFVRHGEL